MMNEQERFYELVDCIPTGIGIGYLYPDGRIEMEYFNDGFYEILGSTREKRQRYMGLHAVDSICPEDVETVTQKIRDVVRNDSMVNFDMRLQRDDGQYLWVNVRANAIEKTKERVKMYGVFSDIDQMYREQEKLQQRYDDQVRFSRMLSTQSMASSMVNLTKNCITLQDTEDEQIMNVITRQTPQEGFESMYPHIPDEKIREEYAAIFNVDTIIRDYENGIASKSIRHPYEKMDTWMESSYNAVRNPSTGDLEVYCFANDMTDQVLQNDITKALMDYEYDDVLLLDTETGEINVVKEAGDALLFDEIEQAQDREIGLMNYYKKYSADKNPERVAKRAKLSNVVAQLKRKKTYTISQSVYNKKGKIVRKRINYSYLNKYKKLIFCTVQDITRDFEHEVEQREMLQKALSQAEIASEAKNEFFSRMSHDMRTPMNGILGLAELAEEEGDIEEMRQCMRKIRSSGEYLLGLINDTLDFQRIESGMLKLEPKPVCCQELLSSLLEMLKPSLAKKKLDLKVQNHNTELDWYIVVDSIRLKQIFINLLSNAIKFTPEGGVISVEIECVEREGMIAHDRFVISDTGIGMSEEFLEKKIFKPFSQESNQVTGMYAGSGLGLSIAKSLVELMGGHIEVESELGVGTTFTFYLDFQKVDKKNINSKSTSETRRKEEIQQLLRGKHILLVEDHPLNAEVASRLLENVGCVVTWRQNGQEGVDAFSQSSPHEYDAILMDIRMPVMNGLEATRMIRQMEREDAKNIPIMAMTANAYEEDVKASKEMGMNEHLSKPIDTMQLYEALLRNIRE